MCQPHHNDYYLITSIIIIKDYRNFLNKMEPVKPHHKLRHVRAAVENRHYNQKLNVAAQCSVPNDSRFTDQQQDFIYHMKKGSQADWQ